MMDRKLPTAVIRFLCLWYSNQELTVRWNASFSSSIKFNVSNRVRQGGVISPILFTIYIDELLKRLLQSGIGYYFDHHFCGAFCYADDIVLLAPSPAALRHLLASCEQFSSEFHLVFNASKTQPICFRRFTNRHIRISSFHFFDEQLNFSDSVLHLGRILTYSLYDDEDIKRATADMCRKTNCMIHLFSSCGPKVLTKLFESYCLSLYGCVTWTINNHQLKALEVAFNNILRKIWKLPYRCHTGILHHVARLSSTTNRIIRMTTSFLHKACSSQNLLIRHVFQSCSKLVYTFTGYNSAYNNRFIKLYKDSDSEIAGFVRDMRLLPQNFNVDKKTLDSIIFSVCCT